MSFGLEHLSQRIAEQNSVQTPRIGPAAPTQPSLTTEPSGSFQPAPLLDRSSQQVSHSPLLNERTKPKMSKNKPGWTLSQAYQNVTLSSAEDKQDILNWLDQSQHKNPNILSLASTGLANLADRLLSDERKSNQQLEALHQQMISDFSESNYEKIQSFQRQKQEEAAKSFSAKKSTQKDPQRSVSASSHELDRPGTSNDSLCTSEPEKPLSVSTPYLQPAPLLDRSSQQVSHSPLLNERAKPKKRIRKRQTYLESIMRKNQPGWTPSQIYENVTSFSTDNKQDILNWLDQSQHKNPNILSLASTGLANLADRLLSDERKSNQQLKALHQQIISDFTVSNYEEIQSCYRQKLEEAAKPFLTEKSTQKDPQGSVSASSHELDRPGTSNNSLCASEPEKPLSVSIPLPIVDATSPVFANCLSKRQEHLDSQETVSATYSDEEDIDDQSCLFLPDATAFKPSPDPATQKELGTTVDDCPITKKDKQENWENWDGKTGTPINFKALTYRIL